MNADNIKMVTVIAYENENEMSRVVVPLEIADLTASCIRHTFGYDVVIDLS